MKTVIDPFTLIWQNTGTKRMEIHIKKSKKRSDQVGRKLQDQGGKFCFDAAMARAKSITGARTQVELGEILGIAQSSVSGAVKNKSFPDSWFMALWDEFGLSPDWIRWGIGPMCLRRGRQEIRLHADELAQASCSPNQSKSQVVQVVMTASKNKDGDWEFEYGGKLAIPATLYRDNLLVVQIQTSSLAPVIQKGAHVGIDMGDVSIVLGEVYALNSLEGITLGRLYQDGKGNLIFRRENNIPDRELSRNEVREHLLGRVIWVIQTLV